MRNVSEPNSGVARFAGSVAVVTGGGHGIGRATAVRLAAEGASVAIVSNDPVRMEEVVALIQAVGGTASAHVADVSDGEAVDRAADEIEASVGRAHVLVNSAGVLVRGRALDMPMGDWDRTFAINVRGLLLVTRRFAAPMVLRGSGAVVNVASTGGLFGVPGLAAYNASKGAVVNLTRNLAVDYAQSGVRINSVCPGWVPTGFNDPMLEGVPVQDTVDHVRRTVPLQRQGQPEEIAAAICFLASDDASYIAGHALLVDGGLTVQL